MKNNKGQALVTFVMIVPIFLFILLMVVDIGRMVNKKLELNGINEILINYSLENLDKENIDSLVNKLAEKNNCKINKFNIDKENNMITITLSSKYNLVLFKNKLYELNSIYKGKLQDGKKLIERDS